MPPKKNEDANGATEALLDSLLGKLRVVALPGEDHDATLARLIGAQATLWRLVGHPESGETRLLAVEHLGPDHTSFATGGQYAVRWVEAEGGTVRKVEDIQELGPEAKPTLSMAWHVASDHLTDRIERWLKPEAYR